MTRENGVGRQGSGASETLKPCPFCGSGNVLLSEAPAPWYAECHGCLSEGPGGDTRSEAIAAWNARTESAELYDALSKCASMIRHAVGADVFVDPEHTLSLADVSRLLAKARAEDTPNA